VTLDVVIRVVAGLAAVALVAAPAVVGLSNKAKAFLAARAVEGAVSPAPGLADMRLVLDLAARLKAAGCPDGVALCQQLLDVLLGNKQAKK